MSGKNNELKITPKRTKLIEKVWYILKPFVVYMVVKTFALLLLALTVSVLPFEGFHTWAELNSNRISAVINGIAAIIGAGFLANDFLKEVNVLGEVDIDAGILKQLFDFVKNGFFGYEKINAIKLAICAAAGAVSGVALNLIIVSALEMLQNVSTRYDSVEAIQYSVPLWLGIILYGLVSPITEELVFRGVIYNRMKRFYSIPRSIVLTALLFGAFHANLPQFLYGACMGILITLSYEKVKCFAAPVIFHMAANIIVFILAMPA